jgi:hypothetical protein
MDTYLSRLFYASTATNKCTPAEIDIILTAGRKNNAALNITGTLCFENHYFLGCLEGPRENINHVFNKIVNDNRHTMIHLLELKEISHRYFDQYLTTFNPTGIIQYIINSEGVQEFNPYLLDSDTLAIAFQNVVETPQATLKPKPKKGLWNLFSMLKH